MQLIYFKGWRSNGRLRPNFGDDLNSWMWEDLLPGFWEPADGITFSGIGTIIDSAMLFNIKKCIVLGSGVGYGSIPDGFGSADWKILSVRGPLSAKVLELESNLALTDAAAALAQIDRFKKPVNPNGDVLFMPHSNSERSGHWQDACEAAGVTYLSPEVDSRLAVDKIRSAKLVLADAMHSAIVADTFRVPWVPVTTSSHNNTFKWLDWTMSLGLPYNPTILPPTSSLEVLRKFTLPICGERFRVSPATPEAAISDFAQKRKWKASPYWRSSTRMASKILISLPQALYSADNSHGIRVSDKNRYIDAAAKALQAAAKGTQYLSDDRVFGSKSAQMMEKLQAIPSIVREWSYRA